MDMLRASQEKVEKLQHQLDWFKRQLFGQKSEKKDFTDNPYQSTIADLFKDLPQLPEQKDEKQTVTYQRGKAKKNVLDGAPEGSNLRFDESVPVEVIHVDPPEYKNGDKDSFIVIGEKSTYRLAQNPASFVVLKYVHKVVKEIKSENIFKAPAVSGVFEKSLADVSFLAGMLIDKFSYHLPLHRQHQRLEANGIMLARSTLTNLTKRAIELLRPIYLSQLEHIMLSRLLAIDETPVKSGKSKKGKIDQAYFWPIMGQANEICFTFSKSRATQHLKDMLGDYKGTILSDGYKAYECYAKALESVEHALCWVHSRRYFEAAENCEPEAAAIAMAYIGKLYEYEKHMKVEGFDNKKKLQYRQKYSLPVVNAFFEWVHEQRQRIDLLPSNPLTKALLYVHNREHGLRVFLGDPEVPLDTNHVERALRCIPMGKRAWLFCWTEIGAEHVGIIQSLISTCRMHDVNPYDYLVDVLQRVDRHPASKIRELTPRVWKEKFADQPLRSDLYKRNYGEL